jgi:hypothetical protein
MKRKPILTWSLALLACFGWRHLFAWQPEALPGKAPEVETTSSAKPADPEATQLVRDARQRLYERQSIQADMNQVVSLGTYQFRSSGKYVSASGFRYRLEYQVQLHNLAGQFLEVCDGQVLHTRRQISPANAALTSTETPEVELTRRDIQTIRREALALKQAHPESDTAAMLQQAEIALGGLPAVLGSLEQCFVFDSKRTDTQDGQELVIVQGHWREDRRNSLLAGIGGAGKQLAGFMPDLVRVSFVRSSLFPIRLEYLKFASSDQKSARPLLTVDYSHVVLDQPVSDALFTYVAPAGLEERDETATFVELMQQSLNSPVASPQGASPESAK